MPAKSKRQEPINRTAIITTTITVVGTIIAALVAAPWIKDVLQRIPTPTSAPTEMFLVLEPTNTITPSMINTTTPTSIPECQTELADGSFKQVLAQNLSLTNTLGSRMMPVPTCLWSSYQPFEGGEMIWRSDTLFPTDIYVLFSSGEWKAYKSNYKSGSPLYSCDTQPNKEKLLQPILGFGKVWCTNEEVKQSLGYANIEENPLDRPRQTFENGWLILINNTVYVLFNSGNWRAIPSFDYKTVSLQSVSELKAPETNLGLAQGIVDLPKSPLLILDPLSGRPLVVPFDIGWKVSTQCEYIPDRSSSIQIGTNISNSLTVYLLLQAGWGLKDYDGQRIGKVSLEFDNDESIDIPLVLGDNIRDWADRPSAVTQVSSSYSQLAWEGKDPNGVPGRIDILVHNIPYKYQALTLKSIQISDESSTTIGKRDPCIHLLAITVKHLP
jgi:hypothetical protein